MKFQQALTLLENKRENKFILKGSEPFLKTKFISIAKEIYPDHTVLFPEDQKEAMNILGSGSLFGSRTLIFIRFDEMDVKKFENAFISYDDCIILSLTDKSDMKSRSMTKIISQMTVVECNQLRPYGVDYPLWINTMISKAGFTAPEKVDELIFNRIGPNMSALAHELEKIFIAKSDNKIITENDIILYLSKTSESSAFEMFEFLLRKNIPAALKSFYSYTRNRSTYFDIVAFLGTYFEKMYRMLLLREKKFEVNDIAEIIGIPPFLVRTRYMPKALSFGKKKISEKINAICMLDVRLRLFKGDNRILMEKFICDFA